MDKDKDRGGARELLMGSTPRLEKTGGAADDGRRLGRRMGASISGSSVIKIGRQKSWLRTERRRAPQTAYCACDSAPQ